jgi:hypothetical protein
MAKHGGSKEDTLASQAMTQMELHNTISSAENAAARLSFDGLLAEINEKAASLQSLAEQISRARARGYIWAADLEQLLQTAQSHAQPSVQTTRTETQRAARDLRGQSDRMLNAARALNGRPLMAVHHEIHGVASQVAGLNNSIDAAERRVREQVAPLVKSIDELTAKLTRVNFTLDSFETASFRLQPEENPVLAVKAKWEDSPQGAREGVLLLTAHRVRFEHQEEVVLERSFIFFASRTEMKKALLLDVLVGQLAQSEDTERGVVFKDQLLVLTLRPGNATSRVTLELDGITAKELDTLIEQLRTGDITRVRYQGTMPENSNVGVPVKWPERCENCGAQLKPPVRGQDLIVCEYCNAKHAVELGQA